MNHLVKMLMLSLTVCSMLYSTGCGGKSGEVQLSAQPVPEPTLTSLQQKQTAVSGLSFDKGMTLAKLDKFTKTVSVSDLNGEIEIRQGHVKDIQVQTVVVVDHATREEAAEVAKQSGLKVKYGKVLEIAAHGKPYGIGNLYYPNINLVITLPKDMTPDLHVELKNGNLSLSKVTAAGKIELSLMNGNITADHISGVTTLQTMNGNVHISEAEKSVRVSVTNGNIEADRISGPLDIETKNGNLSAEDAVSSIRAVAVNGNIKVVSKKVGGDWNVSAVMGDLYLAWPEAAGVEVDGGTMFGEIRTDLPLTVKDKKANGKLGDGAHHIHAETLADLSLFKAK